MEPVVALLRVVKVGGTGKLAMVDLVALCEAAGFRDVRTFIGSGNAVFQSSLSMAETKKALEAQLLINTRGAAQARHLRRVRKRAGLNRPRDRASLPSDEAGWV